MGRKLKNLGLLATSIGQALRAFEDLDLKTCTLGEIKFAHKSMQVFDRLATQPKSTQIEIE